MSQQIFSISQVNTYIQTMMDGDSLLSSVAVRGEISNYKVYPSGHHYFTLKDEASALKCVMFRGNAFRLRFQPQNGSKVVAMGKISVYPRDGSYQLYCTALIPDGVGDLYTQFEELKAKLSAEGLFDQAHKKSLPAFPQQICIITSPAGAAIHDMLRIINKRYPISRVSLLPVRVQGAEAPSEIVSAIEYANRYKLADLLIVGRGGGSIEDLWAFNDEHVARAIYHSEIPVISAVGHEPDVTISDFVADLRAATPSNAAELAVPDQNALLQTMDSMQTVIITALQQRLSAANRQIQMLAASPALKKPEAYMEQKANQLELMRSRLISTQNQAVGTYKQQFLTFAAKLDALSPLKVLTRGYAVVETGEGSVVQSVHQIEPGDEVAIRFRDGFASASVTHVKEDT